MTVSSFVWSTREIAVYMSRSAVKVSSPSGHTALLSLTDAKELRLELDVAIQTMEKEHGVVDDKTDAQKFDDQRGDFR